MTQHAYVTVAADLKSREILLAAAGATKEAAEMKAARRCPGATEFLTVDIIAENFPRLLGEFMDHLGVSEEDTLVIMGQLVTNLIAMLEGKEPTEGELRDCPEEEP